jgi:hypothetical protein
MKPKIALVNRTVKHFVGFLKFSVWAPSRTAPRRDRRSRAGHPDRHLRRHSCRRQDHGGGRTTRRGRRRSRVCHLGDRRGTRRCVRHRRPGQHRLRRLSQRARRHNPNRRSRGGHGDSDRTRPAAPLRPSATSRHDSPTRSSTQRQLFLDGSCCREPGPSRRRPVDQRNLPDAVLGRSFYLRSAK